MFLDDSNEFLRRVREISFYQYAPPEKWATEAVEKQARELETRVDNIIRFLLGERRTRVTTQLRDRSFNTKLAALSALSERIEFRIEEFVSSDVVDVSKFQQLIGALVIAKSLCWELSENVQ